MTRLRRSLPVLGAFALLLLAYSNHFQNGFHFDDTHTIVDNPWVREVRNIPRYFADATTFSVLPANQSYRPVLQTTLAIDYALAGGYDPRTFQVTTFVWFFLQLSLIYLLALAVADRIRPDREANRATALLAAVIYALHPLCAETLNYVIQRGEILSAVGVIGSVVMYARAPALRRFGLYLLPLIFGALAKPPALIAPALLAVYVWLFEAGKPGDHASRRWVATLKAVLPSVIVAIGLAVLIQSKLPETYIAGSASRPLYWLTQPFVVLRYALWLIAPIDLSADTDWAMVTGLSDPRVWYGVVFVAGLVWCAIWTSRSIELRPIAFGLWWFLLTLLPTAVTPLAEVANSQRPFLSFVGLTIAAAWSVHIWRSRVASPRRKLWLAAATCAVLIASATGVYARNDVWRSEETLWRDVTMKSPTNGRGLMNYGLSLMERGDYNTAIVYFQRAVIYAPSYSLAHTNLAIAYGALSRWADADKEFQEGVKLAPADSRTHFYYGRWLRSIGRTADAVATLRLAASLNPFDPLPEPELKQALADQAAGGDGPSPEQLLTLWLAAFQSGLFRDCMARAEEALRLRPDYAEAYNNIAAAHNALGEWDAGIAAAERAVALKPDFMLARNNLAHARSQKLAQAAP